jgi:hypothetical protein
VARAHTGLAELPANIELHRVTPGFLHDLGDRFDLVYSWSVFEHVDERLIAEVLRLIKSSLKPDGLLFVQIAPLFYSAEGCTLPIGSRSRGGISSTSTTSSTRS